MSAISDQPVPKNLREQMVKRVSGVPDPDSLELYELSSLLQQLRLRSERTEEAEKEQARGLWQDLPELIRAYRDRNKAQA
jgi:hypothetical protein